jgi:hypothetical protein
VLKGTPIQELMIALSRVMKIFSEDSLAQKEQPVREQWKVLKEDFHQAKTRYNAIYLTSELAYFLAHLDCLGEGATRVYITNLFWLCKKKSTVVEFLRQFCVGLESPEFEDEIPDRDGYVNVQVSKFSLRAQAKADENSNEKEEEANEADNYLDEVCLLTDYWYRPASMRDMHFAYVREHFHIVKSKPSDKSGMAMQLGHPNPEKRYWRRNENHERQCLIFSGGKVTLLLQ